MWEIRDRGSHVDLIWKDQVGSPEKVAVVVAREYFTGPQVAILLGTAFQMAQGVKVATIEEGHGRDRI